MCFANFLNMEIYSISLLKRIFSWNRDEYQVNGKHPQVATITPVRPARRMVNNVVAPMNVDHTETSVYVNDIENSPPSHSYDNQSFQSHEPSLNGYQNGHNERSLHV